MAMTIEPCPFCGSRDISEGEVLTEHKDGRCTKQNQCMGCGALGPEATVDGPDYGDVQSNAAWNRRAQLSQPAQAVDVTRELAVRVWSGYIESRDAAMMAGGSKDPLDHMQAAITRALAGEKAEGWRPIATAPKDRTDILATDGTEMLVTYWNGASIGWLYSYSDYDVAGWNPTHWMPLPTPPTDGEE